MASPTPSSSTACWPCWSLGLDDGLTPKEFLAVDPKFIERTGVIKTLTPSRVNGFYNIHEQLQSWKP